MRKMAHENPIAIEEIQISPLPWEKRKEKRRVLRKRWIWTIERFENYKTDFTTLKIICEALEHFNRYVWIIQMDIKTTK